MAVVESATSAAATSPAARPNSRRPRSAVASAVRPPATALGIRVIASGASRSPSAPATPQGSVRPRSEVGEGTGALTAMRRPDAARERARVRDAGDVPPEESLDALADGDVGVEPEQPARLLDLGAGGDRVGFGARHRDEVGTASRQN